MKHPVEKHRLYRPGDTFETIALKRTMKHRQHVTVVQAQSSSQATIIEKRADRDVVLELPGHSGRPASRWLVDEDGLMKLDRESP